MLSAPRNCPPPPRTALRDSSWPSTEACHAGACYMMLALEKVFWEMQDSSILERVQLQGPALPAGSDWTVSFPIPHPHNMAGKGSATLVSPRGRTQNHSLLFNNRSLR